MNGKTYITEREKTLNFSYTKQNLESSNNLAIARMFFLNGLESETAKIMILDLIAISSDSFDDAILSIHRTKRMICDVPGCVARASNSEILLVV